jgi:DNA-binding NarL/FixJ family response regulator
VKVLWRVAAALCIAHIVLMLAGYSQQHAPMSNASPAQVVAAYQTGPETKTYVGEYIAVVAFFVLLAAVAALSTLLRSERPAAQWLARLVSTAGVTYVAITVGISFAPAAAAFYLARHGGDPALVAAMDKRARDDGLTDRERDVLTLIAEGASNGQIARSLGISVKTVQNYVSRILDKLQVSDRNQAARRAREGRSGVA